MYPKRLALSTNAWVRTVFPPLASCLIVTVLAAAEIHVVAKGREPVISGKELDWIYGDFLMTNDEISVLIAAPLRTRDANMTIRNIGGSILDLTLNAPSNDQLSAFTPTAGRYLFQDPDLVTMGREGDSVFWECRSSRTLAKDGTAATVRYALRDGQAFVTATVRVEGGNIEKIRAFDGVRADGWFTFESSGPLAHCTDEFFRYAVGFQIPGSKQPPTWKQGRPYQLRYEDSQVTRGENLIEWNLLIHPATSLIDLISATDASETPATQCTFKVRSNPSASQNTDSVNRCQIRLRSVAMNKDNDSETYMLQTDDDGVAHARLKPGLYEAVASAIGFDEKTVTFEWPGQRDRVEFSLEKPSGVNAIIVDASGSPIPVKATIYSVAGDHPDFGPSSARTFVENCVYSVHGRFCCPLDAGTYDIYFSRGPEYNSVHRTVEVVANQMSTIRVQLDRVVESTGWISADLHSHSSPSGDNTSDQYGRVENLLCEHLEFAPCTEHNRISSYVPHLEQMKLSHLLATCSGIELTGSPTPVNHQNAFPLHRHPHTQNGGGPRSASNPVVQIERLAMWDGASDKLVQMNHPNLRQIFGDLDGDGKADGGFRGMFRWTDVVEVHPLETIFTDVVNNPPTGRRARIPLFHWMQLLNQGYRVPGVINTDSHYNHHGSGWRRNWIACSTDDPAQISTEEMVRQAEAGHIVMSTGPFLSVVASSLDRTGEDSAKAIPGDDLQAANGKVQLLISVQAPNWLDVNRVQIFINGRPSSKHNYTRRLSPDLFGGLEDVRKFSATIDVSLERDAHLIVATIGEGMTMEKIMGRRFGKRPPVAVSNPIFVDVDGNGFKSNGDQLGLPLPGVEELR